MECRFQIRPATPADVGAILNFIKDLAAYEKLSHEVTATEELLKQNLFGPRARAEVILASENGVDIGFALFFQNFSTFLGKPGIYLEDVYVKPECRGRGCGKAMMIYIARLAVARDCGRFEWSVLDWNKPSIEFYRSIGAQPMSEWTVQRLTGDALVALSKQGLPELV